MFSPQSRSAKKKIFLTMIKKQDFLCPFGIVFAIKVGNQEKKERSDFQFCFLGFQVIEVARPMKKTENDD